MTGRATLARPARGPSASRALAASGQPGEVLGGAGQVDPAHRRRQEVQQRLEEGRLAGPSRETRDDQRQPRLDQQPRQRRQLGVEDAGRDQLDDRAARRGGRRPEPRNAVVHRRIMTGAGGSGSLGCGDGPHCADRDAAPLEIVPLTPDRWDDVAALFGEGGDPKTCWCMFWRIRSKDWSFGNAAELARRAPRLVDADRDPAPGLLAYRDGRAVGWVSVAPREDYERLTNSRVRPKIDDPPVWSIVCFVVSKPARGQGLTTRLLDAATDYARAHGAPGARGLSGRSRRRTDPGRARLHRALSTFEAAGFEVVHQIDSPQATVRRVIVRRAIGG